MKDRRSARTREKSDSGQSSGPFRNCPPWRSWDAAFLPAADIRRLHITQDCLPSTPTKISASRTDLPPKEWTPGYAA